MTITLSPDLVALIEATIASGRFPSAEAVLREALHQLEVAEGLPDPGPAWLREGCEAGLVEGGEALDVDRDAIRASLFPPPGEAR
jgi:Arc/MetJ-type ribon-helix-helix transcriptional regulator